jgi:hypothetical protein
VTERIICGHECNSANGNWKCYLRPDHAGWHEETFRLRDGGIERTNWGDDGLATSSRAKHTTGDNRPGQERGK